MTSNFKSENYGEIVYEENFWTGKRKITINGKTAEKLSKNVYRHIENDIECKICMTGNFFTGEKLTILDEKNPNNSEIIQVVDGYKWYEFVCAIIGFVFVIAWNFVSVDIYVQFPLVGGAIGGGVSAFLAMLGLCVAGMFKKTWTRILIVLLGSILGILTCWAIGISILLML
ncbi:MAG: hypothetical protein E7353_03035 [Clostridiales bacterium]|nr:hypothetical protein [Clostridiales bacterium]